MRAIYINGRFLTHRVTGTERYALEVLRELDSMVPEAELVQPVQVLVPYEVAAVPDYRNLQIVRVGSRGGHAWEQIDLLRHARQGVLFTPAGGAPVLHPRNVIAIHDASVIAAPNGYSFSFRLWYRVLYSYLCRTSSHVITVSEFSKGELVRRFGGNAANITVTYLGAEHILRNHEDAEILAKWKLKPFRYALAVSSRNPNKNLEGILAAGEILSAEGLQLAIAGGRNARVFGHEGGLLGNVIELGYVNDSELRTLYGNAGCLIFPSFYEGFGLPPLEALACGCPIIVSNTTSLGEIFEGIGFLCDPKDSTDIASSALSAVAQHDAISDGCRTFASGFRWNDCARALWTLLLQKAGDPKPKN